MLSRILNTITICFVLVLFLYFYTITKKVEKVENQDTAMDVFKSLINGDRLNEILHEPVPKLNAAPYTKAEGYNTSVLYMLT